MLTPLPLGSRYKSTALRNASALSVRSQVNSGSLRPKCPYAAVPGHAAIGVDDDLASGQAAVAHRPTDDEAPGRIDMVGDALMIQHVRGDDGFDHVFEHLFADLRKRGARVMLGRH